MNKRSWIIVVTVIVGLAIALGWSLSRSEAPVVIGKVYQAYNYQGQGIEETLNEWYYPVTQCQIVLRYAGAEGTAEISGQESSWSTYVTNGKIIDQVQVDENGVYRFNLKRKPEEVFTGGENQKITAVFYQLEVLVPVQGFDTLKAIDSSQIKINVTEEGTKTIQGPFFILYR